MRGGRAHLVSSTIPRGSRILLQVVEDCSKYLGEGTARLIGEDVASTWIRTRLRRLSLRLSLQRPAATAQSTV